MMSHNILSGETLNIENFRWFSCNREIIENQIFPETCFISIRASNVLLWQSMIGRLFETPVGR